MSSGRAATIRPAGRQIACRAAWAIAAQQVVNPLARFAPLSGTKNSPKPENLLLAFQVICGDTDGRLSRVVFAHGFVSAFRIERAQGDVRVSTDDAAAEAEVPLWLEAARGGSRDALGRLLQTCRQYLLLVANEELEEDLRAKAGTSDLVQETFLKAQRDFPQFRGASEGELFAWLRRILLNNLANFRRQFRDTDKRQVALELSLDDGSESGQLKAALDAGSSTPSQSAMRRELTDKLERALGRLPEHYQQAIRWRQLEQCTFVEIGRRLGASEDSARKLWLRALERLQLELDSTHEQF